MIENNKMSFLLLLLWAHQDGYISNVLITQRLYPGAEDHFNKLLEEGYIQRGNCVQEGNQYRISCMLILWNNM